MTEKDFIKDAFLQKKAYVPYDETVEEREAANETERASWKEVYKFAHSMNRDGRNYEEATLIQLCERLFLPLDKVRHAFFKVFQNGVAEFGLDHKPDILKVELFLRKTWDFVKNEVTLKSEGRPANSESDYEPISIDSVYRRLKHVGFKYSMNDLKSLLKSDFVPTYNPFSEYFTSLEPWDYETDHIGQLAGYIKTTKQEFHVTQFRKMLVRCVGCALYGVENRFIYVLVGHKQEAGKSTFIRFLNPFGGKYYTEAPIRDHKDTYFSFAENFIYNIEELATSSNIEVNHLKAIISMAVIKERKAYAVDAEEARRRVNFFGSTNKDEFLVDDLNTRWLCVEVESINWDYKQDIDINRVWAQAFALWHDCEFNQNLTAEEAREREAINKTYEVTDIEKDLIKQCFEVASETDGEFFSNPDIMTILSAKYLAKPLNSRYIGKCMSQLGFTKGERYINKHKTRGYFAKRVEAATWEPGESGYSTPADGTQEPPPQQKLF